MHNIFKDTSQKRAYFCRGYYQQMYNRNNVELPLQSLSYEVDILNALVNVTIIQSYQNNLKQFLELEFTMPVSPNICLHRFIASFDSHIMEGVIKEKEQAESQFNQAVSSGKRAALGHTDEKDKSLMVVKLGNIAPEQIVKIQLVYVEELSLAMNTFYKFSIPIQTKLNEPISEQENEQNWSFKLKLRATHKINAYKSNLNLNLQKNNNSNHEYQFKVKRESFINTNVFQLYYKTDQIQLPTYTLGRSDAGSSVMVSFIPKFCSLNLDDAQISALNANNMDIEMDSVKGEYIFFLDRSGSMGGSQITNAKKALIMFLKSLPVDTYFNVISFGSNSQMLYPSSVKNTNQNISQSIKKIETMIANMGGTQIYKPLVKVLNSTIIKGYLRQIFLLTDGQVENTQAVLELIKKNTKYSRLHAIGIGNSSSRKLIQGSAKNGKGYSIFVNNYEDPSAKVIQLLTDSLTPTISEVKVCYDKDVVESIVPNPESIPYILKGDLCNFYLTFKGQLQKQTKIVFEYQDSHNKLPFRSEIVVSPESPSEAFIDKMGYFRSISALEQAQQFGTKVEDYIYFVKAINKKQQIINLSLKNQILSKYTSFLCVQKQLFDGKYQQIKDKGTVKLKMQAKPKLNQNQMQQNQDNEFCFAQPIDVIDIDLANVNNCIGIKKQCGANQPAGNPFLYKPLKQPNLFGFAPAPIHNAFSTTSNQLNNPYEQISSIKPQFTSQSISPPPDLSSNILPPPPPYPPSSYILPPPPPYPPSSYILPPPPPYLSSNIAPPPYPPSSNILPSPRLILSQNILPPPPPLLSNMPLSPPPPLPPLSNAMSSLGLPPPPPSINSIPPPNKASSLDFSNFFQTKLKCSQPKNSAMNQQNSSSLMDGLKQKISQRFAKVKINSSDDQQQIAVPKVNELSQKSAGDQKKKTFLDLFGFGSPATAPKLQSCLYSAASIPVPVAPKLQELQQQKCKQKKKTFNKLFGIGENDDFKIAQKKINPQPIQNKNISNSFNSQAILKGKKQQPKPKPTIYTIQKIISEQQVQGFWTNINIVISIFGEQVGEAIKSRKDQQTVITYLIVRWIEKNHPQKQFTLIVKKANSWLKKSQTLQDCANEFSKYVK